MAGFNRWWIQLGSRRIGPVSSAELREMASSGRVDEKTPVSPDQKQWKPAGVLQELHFVDERRDGEFEQLHDRPPSQPPPITDDPNRVETHHRRQRLFFWTAASILICATTVGGLVVILRNESNQRGAIDESSNRGIRGSRNVAKQKSPKPADDIANIARKSVENGDKLQPKPRKKKAKRPGVINKRTEKSTDPDRISRRDANNKKLVTPKKGLAVIGEIWVDQVIKAALKPTSLKYLERGYRSLEFGSSRRSVARNREIRGKLVPHATSAHVAVDQSGYRLYFKRDQLRAIVKSYRGNNAAYLKKLIGLFGRTSKEHIVSRADPTARNRPRWSNAYFCFPKVLVCIQSKVENVNDEIVTVVVVDKAWLEDELRRYLQGQSRVFNWLTLHVHADVAKGTLDLKELRFPKKKQVFAPVKKDVPFKWFGLTGRSDLTEALGIFEGTEVFLVIERFQYRKGPRVAFIPNDTPKSGTVSARAYFESAFPPGGNPIHWIAFEEWLTPICGHLAQLYFPPDGGTFTELTDRATGVKSYRWTTKEGWSVQVDRRGIVKLLKKPEVKL